MKYLAMFFLVLLSVCATGQLLEMKGDLPPVWLIVAWAVFWAVAIEATAAMTEQKKAEAERKRAEELELEKHRITLLHHADKMEA